MLVGFQATVLMGAGEVDEPLRLLQSLPADPGSVELDGVRGGGALGLAKAATRDKRIELLVAAAKLAEPIRDAHFAAIVYRHLARCAFQLGLVAQGESFVKLALKAIDAFPIGSYVQPFHMSRLGIAILALGDHDRGMALLERAASMPLGYVHVVSDVALFIETRKDPRLLDAAYRFARDSGAASCQAEAEAYIATIEARLGNAERAVQRLVASARRLEKSEATHLIKAAAIYAETLVELGAQEAADEVFSKLLSGRIRDKDTNTILFRPAVDCIALTYAHRAAATLDKALLYKALDLVKNGALDPAVSPDAENDRYHMTEYVVYLARRTSDARLVREAMRLAARLEKDAGTSPFPLGPLAADEIAYAAGGLLDAKLIEEVATWGRTQRSRDIECSTYLCLAAGMLSALRSSTMRALDEGPMKYLYEDRYPDMDRKLKWVAYPSRLSRQVFLFEDETIPERLPFDLRGTIQ